MNLDDRVDAGDVSDVSNSTAFLCIDTLLEDRKIVEERADLLKGKYKELHDRVLTIYANDNFLLKRARVLRKDLEAEKQRVERCADVAANDDSQIQTLKNELAEVELDLSSAQEKESMLQVESLELERKKQTLEHDVRESVAQEEAKLKPLIEQHNREITGIAQAAKKVEEEIGESKQEHDRLVSREQQVKQEIEQIIEDIYSAKVEFARVEKEPDRARTQTESVLRNLIGGKKELKTVMDRQVQLKTLERDVTERRQQLLARRDDLKRTIDADRVQISKYSKMLNHLMAGSSDMRDRVTSATQTLMGTQEGIQQSIHGLAQERDNFVRVNREREAELKNYKKIDQQKSDHNYECDMIQKQREVLIRQRQRLMHQRAEAEATLEELKRDVDILINNFLKEELMEKRSISDKEEMVKLIRELERDVLQRSAEEQAQRRELAALALNREKVSHDASRNASKLDLADNELKVQMRVYEEFTKQLDELKRRHADAMKRYAVVKREKSFKAKQIQDASHTMSETQEKMKMLEEELQSKRRESVLKDAELKRKEREEYKLRQLCKNLRVERHKWTRKRDTAQLRQQDLKQQMTKLNTIITATEQDMISLKQSYEEAVENRNFTGIQLIDRNDELCVLYEKANVQEGILKRGMMELQQRDNQIRKLSIQLADLQREIELCQRLLPQVRDMEEDLAEVLAQLEEERWRAEVLENDITDPENPNRWRKLEKIGKARLDRAKAQKKAQEKAKNGTTGDNGNTNNNTSNTINNNNEGGGGADDSAAAGEGKKRVASDDLIELSEKQQQLELRLAEVNERLMEKDLVLEELTELSNRLRQQANNGRDFTRAQAKRVNFYQFGIKAKTKKMMATLSELSMVQASTIKLEMDVRNAEEQLGDARTRAEQGLAPTDDVAERYEKDRKNEERMNDVLRTRKERETAAIASPDAMRTTAEKRPTSYIPDNELGLPLPFGSHAPFKPTVQAQHNVSRFCRKPRVAEINFDQ